MKIADHENADKMRWKSAVYGRPARMELLWQRQVAISTIRDDLYAEGFLEVETPLIVKGTCPDTYIESVPVEEGYLITSTEYQIKRLIVGGFEKIFTLTKNFRAHEQGRYHSSEFTMLEWARAFVSLDQIEEDAMRFIRKAFAKLHPNQDSLHFLGYEIDFMKKPWERLTVREAFKIHLGLHDLEDFSLAPLLRSVHQAGVSVPVDFQEDKYLVITYLLDLLQSHLGKQTPTFLGEWPAYLTTSAPICSKDPHVAARSELYIGGIEISNGFPFLTDANLQKNLFEQELKQRQSLDKSAVVIDNKYLDALNEGLPSGAGMALGIDRLIMVLTEATQLSDVQAFAWDEL